MVSVTILILMVALLVASPSWLLRSCNTVDDCGTVSPTLLVFIGILAASVCALVGMMRSSR